MGIPTDGSWLVKPRASAGGRAIAPWSEGMKRPIRASYWQERIEGLDLSASYCAGDVGVMVLGVTRQLLGRPGSEFAYRGSIGPWPVSDYALAGITWLGETIARGFGLKGLFGIDLILKDDVPFPVEINPRYSASMEVLELALGRSFLETHRRAFETDCKEMDVGSSAGRRPIVAKAILFADRPTSFRDRERGARRFEPWRLPGIADIPDFGTQFEAGEPILTVFSRGSSIESAASRLDRKLAAWRAWLGA